MDESEQGSKKKRPIPLSIDLNEIPVETPSPHPLSSSPLDAFALVCRYHGALAPAEGAAAEFPGEAGAGAAAVEPCGLCGRPETRGGTVVCDGCERGFHVGCLRVRERQQALVGDWACGECALTGPAKKRWVLGAVRLLDINELPPCEGDGEATVGLAEEVRNTGRMNNPDGDCLNGDFGGQYSWSNMVHIGNIFDLGNHSGTMADTMQTSSEVISHHGLNASSYFEDLVLDPSHRGRPSVDNTSISVQFNGELFLHSLRDFIVEKGGTLGEGWHVEFKQSPNGSDSYAVYCAPDGKKFESMFDVAHYLGLSSGITPMEIDERTDGSGTVQRPLVPRRRKKDLTRNSATNKLFENQDNVRSSCGGELLCDAEILPQNSDVRSAFTKSYTEGNDVCGSQNLSVALPIQYEDFYVICLGKVDLRMAYHDKYQIWPIGYKSSWHDKITGSVFECEVSDGGDSGPVFKVRRCPCSLSPIPNGATILLHNKPKKTDIAERTKSSSVIFDAGYDKDEDILMLLSDPNPSEQDLFSCFGHDIGGSSYGCSMQIDREKPYVLTDNLNCYPERSGEPSDKSFISRDEIGEFYVEGRSSSSVWKMVSQTLIDACHEVYRQSGRLQFCCRHDHAVFSSYLDDGTVKGTHQVGTLARFCCAYGPINTPRVVRNDSEMEVSCNSLTEWLGQDRFGLNIGFVQEIIETLPPSRTCSRYIFLSDRGDFSSSWTVGSGLLLATQKNGERGGEEVVSYGLYSGENRSRQQDSAEAPAVAEKCPPPGRPISSKLSTELVGDVFQIWELLWRFHEVLGLKEPLSLEELIEELIDPWPCSSNLLEKIEKENRDCRDQASLGSESVNCSASLGTGVSDSTTLEQNQFRLIPVETAATREAAQAKVASHTYGRCTGVALTKAHISLLKVLVGELLSKVAVFLDPNVDARESKSRRGRKKDIENSFSTKDLKNELLVVNELTWPALARRYVLAFLSMNGRMESQEVCGRESLKVFRCLQGDGGVLCGSLSGVAGMEADALLLAEAERQISVSTKRENEVLPVDYKDSEAIGAQAPAVGTSNSLPEWAQLLEPVRKLPTNVGTRIRKCIYESLERDPPEWAKEILLHSISKEVYKGNASGPTKKAVLSVLAKATGGSLPQKSDKGQKGRKPLSILDAIMKKCRIVLRRAAAADETKVFCNLLGTTLLQSNDNDDDGILGSPAMISRPLDFRTIDLRLAFGAYGSHETFLEEVREVWRNLCTAYGDRPDLMQMLENLSQNFESLYEEEVLHLTEKLGHLSGTERLDAETQKELNDVLLGVNDIPKAPWEDGVCKVCGIDKDDDSVLLCDSCDSEYHRYCLDPPLARIPEGNWYCPSCVVGQRKALDASQNTQAIKTHSSRHLGDETRALQEPLNQLATTMEGREYWEYSIEERICLLKFLCDEVLNSALIREHLEQCIDKSSDLQQKMRALTIDWRNLKFKEELLAMRTVKESTNKSTGGGGHVRAEGPVHSNQGRAVEQQQPFSNKLVYMTDFSQSPLERACNPLEKCLDENGQMAGDKNMSQLLNSVIEKHANGNRTQMEYSRPDSIVAECTTHNSDSYFLNKASLHGNPFSAINVSNGAKFTGQEQSAVLSQQCNEVRGVVVNDVDQENVQRRLIAVAKTATDGLDIKIIQNAESNGSVRSSADILHGSYLSSDHGRTQYGENTLSTTVGNSSDMTLGEIVPAHQNTQLQGNHFNVPADVIESEANNDEVSSLKNEISNLQDSIAGLESQLMMTSLRREYLGRDSIGRLYWAVSRPGRRPWLVVGGCVPVPWEGRKTNEITDPSSHSSVALNASSSLCQRKNYPGIPSHCSPFDCDSNNSVWSSCPLVLYESDDEIQLLLSWLRDDDPRERELKECLFQWQRLVLHQESIFGPNDPKPEPSSFSGNRFTPPDSLTTKAAILLENKYGPCLDPEVSEIPKKRGRKAKISNEERMFRCECLEPVWPSRYHCLSCHHTFCTVKEFEGHNDGRCPPTVPASDDGKESDDPIKGKGTRPESTREKELSGEVETVEMSKSGKFEISSKSVKFQRKACPYDLDEISKKFITNDSLKDLVNEIGLLGSNGVPSLISSPPMFFDPPQILNQRKDNDTDPKKGLASSYGKLLISTQNVGTRVPYGDTGNVAQHGTHKLPQNYVSDGNSHHLPKTAPKCAVSGEISSHKVQASLVIQSCTIPESSLRPLIGKVSYIRKRLKINLLDMEAALPEEALRPSKSHIMRRCAWRAFVKSAESTYEMVQATVLLEGMIKPDYLKNGWWYWSSITAAAKTPTVSSLALRIYSLDDSIIYIKDKDSQTQTSLDPLAENLRLTNKAPGKKKKDMADVGPS